MEEGLTKPRSIGSSFPYLTKQLDGQTSSKLNSILGADIDRWELPQLSKEFEGVQASDLLRC